MVNQKKLKGFTLVELMVTLAIGAILLAWGVPSYQAFSIRQNLSAQANDLIGDFNYARQTAIHTGLTVNVTSPDWTLGWTITSDGEVLRNKQRSSQNGNYTITGVAGLDDVEYNSLGNASLFGSLIASHPSAIDNITITVTPSGMVSSDKTL